MKALIASLMFALVGSAHAQLTDQEKAWTRYTNPFYAHAKEIGQPFKVAVVTDAARRDTPVQMRFTKADRTCTIVFQLRGNEWAAKLEQIAADEVELDALRLHAVAHEYGHCMLWRDDPDTPINPAQQEAIADIYGLEWIAQNMPDHLEAATRVVRKLRGEHLGKGDRKHDVISYLRLYWAESKSAVSEAPIALAVRVVTGRAAVAKVEQ